MPCGEAINLILARIAANPIRIYRDRLSAKSPGREKRPVAVFQACLRLQNQNNNCNSGNERVLCRVVRSQP
jgi:hypothetical protein